MVAFQALPDIDAKFLSMDIDLAMSTVERALADGHDRRLLRWRVSPAQGCAMHRYNLSIALNPSPPAQFMESGAAYESGWFLGIPFAVDRTIPSDCVWLECLEPTPLIRVHGLIVPRGFGS